MANKASFSPHEWTKVLQSVMMTAIAVTASETSGLGGTLKGSMVAGRALIEAKSDAKSNELGSLGVRIEIDAPKAGRRPRACACGSSGDAACGAGA